MPFPFRRVTAAIEAWFADHQRPLPWRATYDPYLVWLSEVMLQQTRMEVVLRYFSNFVKRFPTLEVLAESSEGQVLASWSGLGYYRRARMLRDGAGDVLKRFGGAVPRTVDELTTIAGIGRYTAGAIASIAHGEKAAIVDGNVARILSRLFGIEAAAGSPDLMRAAWVQSARLVAACRSPREFNQGLMEIGALICTPRNPDCPRCPVKRFCRAYESDRVADLPLRKQKRATTAMTIPLYIVSDRSGRVLMRREMSMFRLPDGDSSFVTVKQFLGSFRHTVTTRKIQFRVFAAELVKQIPHEYVWIDRRKMADVAHASYITKALALSAPLE